MAGAASPLTPLGFTAGAAAVARAAPPLQLRLTRPIHWLLADEAAFVGGLGSTCRVFSARTGAELAAGPGPLASLRGSAWARPRPVGLPDSLLR